LAKNSLTMRRYGPATATGPLWTAGGVEMVT
jgi:hypothetical protein